MQTHFIGKSGFLVADTQLYKRLCLSVGWLVGWLVGRSVVIKLKSGKTRISAPAHPSATGGRVSGLVEFGCPYIIKIGSSTLETRGMVMDISHLGASHNKSLEFLLVPLTQCGGTNFKALTIFPFPQIGHLPFT